MPLSFKKSTYRNDSMRKYNKEDKKFLINLYLKNRDFLTTLSHIQMTWLLSISAFIISTFSFLISTQILTNYVLYVFIPMMTILALLWIKIGKNVRQSLGGAKKFNEMYQKYYFDLYPEKKNEPH